MWVACRFLYVSYAGTQTLNKKVLVIPNKAPQVGHTGGIEQ